MTKAEESWIEKVDHFNPWDGLYRDGVLGQAGLNGKDRGEGTARIETLVFIWQAVEATGSSRAEKGHG